MYAEGTAVRKLKARVNALPNRLHDIGYTDSPIDRPTYYTSFSRFLIPSVRTTVNWLPSVQRYAGTRARSTSISTANIP